MIAAGKNPSLVALYKQRNKCGSGGRYNSHHIACYKYFAKSAKDDETVFE